MAPSSGSAGGLDVGIQVVLASGSAILGCFGLWWSASGCEAALPTVARIREAVSLKLGGFCFEVTIAIWCDRAVSTCGVKKSGRCSHRSIIKGPITTYTILGLLIEARIVDL